MKHTHFCGHSAFVVVVCVEETAATRSGTSSTQTDTSTSSLMSLAQSATNSVSDKQPLSRRAAAPRVVHRTSVRARARARTRAYSRALSGTFTAVRSHGDQWERIRSGLLDLRKTRVSPERSRTDGGEERGRRDRPVQFPRGGSHYTAAPTRVHSGSGSIRDLHIARE